MGRGLRKDASDPQKQLSILDLALNLRRRHDSQTPRPPPPARVPVCGAECGPRRGRWKRLAEELPDAEVREMLSSFWMVSNFVGAAIE
jgi:hypothetical protein